MKTAAKPGVCTEPADFQNWKFANSTQEFSAIDYVYGVIQTKRLHPDFMVCILALLWPDFIEIDGRIFLRSAYSAHRHDEFLSKAGGGSDDSEYWMNLTMLDALFESDDGHILTEHANKFLDALAEMWRARLQLLYPTGQFKVTVINDAESGDFGITFSQAQ